MPRTKHASNHHRLRRRRRHHRLHRPQTNFSAFSCTWCFCPRHHSCCPAPFPHSFHMHSFSLSRFLSRFDSQSHSYCHCCPHCHVQSRSKSHSNHVALSIIRTSILLHSRGGALGACATGPSSSSSSLLFSSAGCGDRVIALAASAAHAQALIDHVYAQYYAPQQRNGDLQLPADQNTYVAAYFDGRRPAYFRQSRV